MSDANGLNPGDSGYDPSSDQDTLYGSAAQTPTGGVPPSNVPPGTLSPIIGTPVPLPSYTGPTLSPTTPGIAGTAAPVPGAATSDDPLQYLGVYLSLYPNDPQRAIDEINRRFPGNTIAPVWYPGSKTIGLANGTYLVAPHTGANNEDTWYTQKRATGAGAGGGDATYGQGQVDPYTALTTPAGLQTPYTAERFKGPTLDDLLNSPGYKVGLDTTFRGIERKQAAQGSILSGGARQALIKGGQDYASRSYGDLYNQYLNAYQANGSQALGARQQNNSEFQSAVGNNLNQYNTRYKAYEDAINNNFNLADLGVRATQAGAPS